ncbi:MAG TPA: PQQ-dependent dehydrogenase, methanol/ethanol family, partial [Bradyrhizobium sp.]|nr:PQQ-dependent dehydrogenase, methanol/ethanol family [Bradyrhizobium sp.]
MKKLLVVSTSVLGLMALQGSAARADDALEKLAKDPKQWVMQQGDDANTRYSKLSQINSSNVKK